MEVHVDSAGGLRREMRVRVPAEQVAKAVDERLNKLARRAKLPGFRPGKAPRKVIEQQYGPTARYEAISDVIQETYPQAVTQAGVNPAGQPKIDITAEKEGEAFEYVAHFEVYPEVQLNALDQLAIERPLVTVGEADVDRLIGNLRKARRTFNEVSRAAQNGDQVKIDFLGKVDGEAFAGGEGKDVQFEIGESRFLPDLENGVVGHSAGESFVVDVKFPEDYRAENLKGKTAQFEVTLKQVNEPKLPEIDAEFLKAHQVEEGAGEAGLRAKCQAALEKERDKAVANRLKSQALEQLLQRNPLELPRALIEQEIPNLRREAAARMNMANVDAAKQAELLPDQLFEQTASRRVALGLLIGEVIKAKDIKLDAARVEAALDGMAGDYEQPEQVKAYYRSRPELMQGLRAMALEDQVVDALLSGASVTEQTLSLEQLLNPQAPN
ncbi:trigger factor [Solimonas aquatica]|uniref:Trigger factor n=1 Tax=Solimonas aquatica TaxID=489703 RepID=A0A1H8ZPL2_9GAMM|nr:trigger factor [Solimonas aquatica]SEP66315.1 trigger factor [Solimonas aquatica]